jgi:hypothetical protein
MVGDINLDVKAACQRWPKREFMRVLTQYLLRYLNILVTAKNLVYTRVPTEQS